jgi:hypothetical protein
VQRSKRTDLCFSHLVWLIFNVLLYQTPVPACLPFPFFGGRIDWLILTDLSFKLSEVGSRTCQAQTGEAAGSSFLTYSRRLEGRERERAISSRTLRLAGESAFQGHQVPPPFALKDHRAIPSEWPTQLGNLAREQ